MPSDLSNDSPIDTTDAATWQFSCEEPTLVGTGSDKNHEPGIRAGGLEIWAAGSKGMLRTRRATLQDEFGPWTGVDTGGHFGNPAFFSWKGVEYALAHRQDRPTGERLIDLCTLDPISCDTLTFTYRGSGAEVTMDSDGPSAAVVDGKLMMLLNIGADAYAGDVYQATPVTDASLLTWNVDQVPPFVDPSVHEDDPALMPDGTMMVVSMGGGLWVAHRQPGAWFFVAEIDRGNPLRRKRIVPGVLRLA